MRIHLKEIIKFKAIANGNKVCDVSAYFLGEMYEDFIVLCVNVCHSSTFAYLN